MKVRCIIQDKAKILIELANEETAIIANFTQNALVLNLFQHCPIIKAANVLPNPLYPSGHPIAASRKRPANDPTKRA